MEDNKPNFSLDDLINDLDNKVEELNKAVGFSFDSSDKANNIKEKAVAVLDGAKDKALRIATSGDNKEIAYAIELIKDKSQSLYEDAIERINDINSKRKPSKLAEPANEISMADLQEVTKTIEEEAEVEEEKKEEELIEVNPIIVKEEQEEELTEEKEFPEISEKSINVLKEWLMPKGENE